MANLIFTAFLAVVLGQAAWIRVVSGSPEAWQQLAPRLIALLVLMGITTGVGSAGKLLQRASVPLVAFASAGTAMVGLVAVVSYAAYYIVMSGGDAGWCLIAILCVIAQAVAIAPILKARRTAR